MSPPNDTEHAPAGGPGSHAFMRSALAIGGADALGASLTRVGLSGAAGTDPATVEERDDRQHAWSSYLTGDEPTSPRHHVLLFLDYRRRGEPSAADRREMEGALRQLERAFEWSDRGLLFAVGYSRRYFERFDDDLPAGIDLRPAGGVVDAVGGRAEPEPYDLVVHLASDNATNVLAAEEALWGDRDVVAGVAVDRSFDGLFDRPTTYPGRRTGFVGEGLPVEEFDNADVPADAALSMGVGSPSAADPAAEDAVTLLGDQRRDGESMPPGAFAQGTVLHASRLDLDLDAWYDRERGEREERMLGDGADADGHAGRLGAASAGGEGRPGLLPRRFNTTDDGDPGLYFLAAMRYNGAMVRARHAMDDADGDGLAPFLDARRRGNFLVPPLSLRSLPPARGTGLDVEVAPDRGDAVVDRDDDVVSVAVYGPAGARLADDEPVATRFGPPPVVDRAGGAKPVGHDLVDLDGDGSDDLLLHFRTDDAGFGAGDDAAKLLVLDGDLRPAAGAADVAVE